MMAMIIIESYHATVSDIGSIYGMWILMYVYWDRKYFD